MEKVINLVNAFSPNMIQFFPVTVKFSELTVTEAKKVAEKACSCVGHSDTAAVFASVLGTEVPTARVTLVVVPGDVLLLGQYKGPRLPEGATSLPEGATIVWLLVEVGH